MEQYLKDPGSLKEVIIPAAVTIAIIVVMLGNNEVIIPKSKLS